MYINKNVYKLLHTFSEIKIPEIPVYPEIMVFDNGPYNVITGKKIHNASDFFLVDKINAKYLPGQYLPTPEFDRF